MTVDLALPSQSVSVIIALADDGPGQRASLAALASQTLTPDEVVVVGVGADAVAAGGIGRAVVRAIEAPAGTLVPRLWAAGLRRASGDLVALTASPCVPADDWLACLHATLVRHPTCAAVGGPIKPPDTTRASHWAAYLTRYHAFLPGPADGEVDDLPGENVAYRRRLLDAVWPATETGLWEVAVHQRLRARGFPLRRTGAARVRVGDLGSAWRFARLRHRHGRHFGARRESSRAERLARLATTPALPPLLLGRMLRRALRRRPADWRRWLCALPWLAVFVTAWSVGEARGYWSAR